MLEEIKEIDELEGNDSDFSSEWEEEPPEIPMEATAALNPLRQDYYSAITLRTI